MKYPELHPKITSDCALPELQQHILKTCTYSEATVFLHQIYNSKLHGDKSSFESRLFNTVFWQQLTQRDFPYNYPACLINAPKIETADCSRIYWESTYKALFNKVYGHLSPDIKRLFLYITAGNFSAIQAGFQENHKSAGFACKLKLSDLFIVDGFIKDKSLGSKQSFDSLQLCIKKERYEYLSFFFNLAQTQFKDNVLDDDLENYAALFGQWTALSQLLGNRSDLPDFLQKKGMHLLSCAATYNHEKTVDLILTNYYSYLVPSTVYNPLYLASLKGHARIVSLLLQRGFTVDYQTFGGTPLYIAVKYNHKDVVDILLEYGADPNKNKDFNPLRIACELGHYDIAEELLKNNATPNQRGEKQITPLFIAVKNGDLALAQLLIQHKAKVDHEDGNGETPLFSALRAGDLSMVKCLLEAGANVQHRNSHSKQPYDLALKTIFEYLHNFIHYMAFVSAYSCKFQQIRNMFIDYSGHNSLGSPIIAKAFRFFEFHWNCSHCNEVFELLNKPEYNTSWDYNLLLAFLGDLKEKLKDKDIKPYGDLAAIFSLIKLLTGLDYFHMPESPKEVVTQEQPALENALYPDLFSSNLRPTLFDEANNYCYLMPSAPPYEVEKFAKTSDPFGQQSFFKICETQAHTELSPYTPNF